MDICDVFCTNIGIDATKVIRTEFCVTPHFKNSLFVCKIATKSSINPSVFIFFLYNA